MRRHLGHSPALAAGRIPLGHRPAPIAARPTAEQRLRVARMRRHEIVRMRAALEGLDAPERLATALAIVEETAVLDGELYDVVVGRDPVAGLEEERAQTRFVKTSEFSRMRAADSGEGWSLEPVARHAANGTFEAVSLQRDEASLAEFDERIAKSRTLAQMLEEDPRLGERAIERMDALAARLETAWSVVDAARRDAEAAADERRRREIAEFLDL